MSFQWLTMRIGEERDRRAREAQILGMLPAAVDDLHQTLADCVAAFTSAFGDTARIEKTAEGLRVAAANAAVDLIADPDLPGFQIRHADSTLAVQIGVLPGGKLFYFDVATDKYLTMEDVTRRILDRVLFPKLRD